MNNPTCSSALAITKKKDVQSELVFLTSEYLCVPGCNSFDLDNARLCSLGENKKKLELYIQYNIYPSKDAQLCYWLRVWLRWPQGRNYLALHAWQLSFSSRELWKKWISPEVETKYNLLYKLCSFFTFQLCIPFVPSILNLYFILGLGGKSFRLTVKPCSRDGQ